MENLPGLLKQLTVESSKLRLEQQHQFENQERKMAELERALQQVQGEQRQLQEQERAFNQEIAQLDQHLGQPTLAAEERAGPEAVKAELVGGGLERGGPSSSGSPSEKPS